MRYSGFVTLALGLLVVFDPFTVVHGQGLRTAGSIVIGAADAPSSSKRSGDLVCTMSAFFSADADQAFRTKARFDGRGLVTCQNDQGFTTEFPVLADLDADLAPSARRGSNEVTVSGNSSSFVIPRETAQMQDSFSVRQGVQAASLGTGSAATNVLLRGMRHDLVIDLRLSSGTIDISELKVTGLRLRFDDTVPDLF